MILYALSCLWHEVRDSEEQEKRVVLYIVKNKWEMLWDAEAIFFIYENKDLLE